VLAWSCLIVVVAAGMKESVRPAQANIRIASGTTQVTLASTLTVAAARRAAARPAGRYVVQPGDTLSGIAARLAVRGGWPALYAANRPRIGPDPDVIRPGTVLVLPGRMAPGRYRAAPVGTPAGSSPGPGYGQVAAEKAGIVLADHDRVVVTRSTRDGAVHVLRPPGEDPAVILRAARLVLPEDLYRELAERLGMPGA